MYAFPLEKAEGPEIKLPTSAGSEKAKEFQKNIYFCFIDYTKAFDHVDHNGGKFFKRWEYQTTWPAWEICMQVKKQQLEPDLEQTGSKSGKEYVKENVTLFNLYAEYITQNAGLVEAQVGIKTRGRNINNLRYEDDTTL